MKTALAALGLLLAPVAVAQTKPAAPQTPPPASSTILPPPPIKMGLWKSTTTSTMAGFKVPPEFAERLKAMGKSLGGPETVNTLSCITPEKWQQMFNRQQHNQDCSFSNVRQSSSGMSADMTCTSSSGRANSTGHMDMTFDSDSKMHGKFHINVTMESQPQPMTIDSTIQSDYQGSDCQGVSPDTPKIVH